MMSFLPAYCLLSLVPCGLVLLPMQLKSLSKQTTKLPHKQDGVNSVQQEGNALQFPIPSSLQRTDGSCDLLVLIALHGMLKECSR